MSEKEVDIYVTASRLGKYSPFIFFFSSIWAGGIQNPRIRLANDTLVAGPAFYDTAHGPDFFRAEAITAI